MKRILLFIALASLTAATPAFAQYIWLDLSFKAVLNPTNGTRFYSFTETDIDTTIAEMNRMLGRYQRGYRMRRVDPLLDVGSVGDPSGPSKWFFPNPRDPYNASIRNQEQMESEALANPIDYRWNSNAINYYILAGLGPCLNDTNGRPLGQPAGESSYPASGHKIITLGTVHFPIVILHETGHWFGLFHTQGDCNPDTNGLCGVSSLCPIVKNGFRLGDDGVADTLPVQAGDFCFVNQDLVALANFGIPYAACSSEQSNLVDDAFFNLMAYGFDRTMDRLTPQQLDYWTAYADGSRGFVASGLCRFVSPTGNDTYYGWSRNAPKRTVLNAANSSNPAGGDIILLAPGNYNEQITLNKPVTIRAAPTNSFAAYPRSATIGR